MITSNAPKPSGRNLLSFKDQPAKADRGRENSGNEWLPDFRSLDRSVHWFRVAWSSLVLGGDRIHAVHCRWLLVIFALARQPWLITPRCLRAKEPTTQKFITASEQ